MNAWQINHTNSAGNGSVLTLALFPAKRGRDGFIRATIAPQNAEAVTTDLDWTRITEIIRVTRGEVESIGDGRGSFRKFENGGATAKDIVKFAHYFNDYTAGYDLDFYYAASEEQSGWLHGGIHLTPSEALSLQISLEGAFSAVVFGYPDFRMEANG